MTLALIMEFPGVTQEQYEAAGKAVGDPRANGALVHIAGPTEGGWRVVEVWPSQEAVQSFFGNLTVQNAFQNAVLIQLWYTTGADTVHHQDGSQHEQ